MKMNEKGFSLVEFLLVVLVVSFIGFAGWYVFDSRSKNKSVPNSSPTTTESKIQQSDDTNPETTRKDETSEWFLYKSPNDEYQMKLVDGWEMTRHVDSSAIVSFKPLTYKPGIKATVTVIEGGRGGPFPLYVNLSKESPSVRGKLQGEVKTDSGLVGQKYQFTETSDEAVHDIQQGEKEYSYHFNKNGKYITIVHAIYGDSKDNTEYVEKAIKTLVIN